MADKERKQDDAHAGEKPLMKKEMQETKGGHISGNAPEVNLSGALDGTEKIRARDSYQDGDDLLARNQLDSNPCGGQ